MLSWNRKKSDSLFIVLFPPKYYRRKKLLQYVCFVRFEFHIAVVGGADRRIGDFLSREELCV
jgi:hypothetical protein